MPDLLDHRTADWLRTLAPRDLADAPVYVVNASALPPDRGGRLAHGGVTSRTLDLELRDVLGPAWEGRGPAMIVNDAMAAAALDTPADVASWLRSITLHEIAHVFARRRTLAPLDLPPAHAREYAGEMARRDASPARDAAGNVAMPDPRMHGPAFTRAALHLWVRAGGWDSDLQPRLINGGYSRGPRYAGAKRYLAVLGDELDRLRDASFAELRKLPLPPAFVALWKADAGLAPALPAVPTPCPVPRSYLPDPPDEETTP